MRVCMVRLGSAVDAGTQLYLLLRCPDVSTYESIRPKEFCRWVSGPVQSFLTLYTSCVRELVQLLRGCRNVQPFLKDPAAPFASPTERRIQSLVRTSAVLASFPCGPFQEAAH